MRRREPALADTDLAVQSRDGVRQDELSFDATLAASHEPPLARAARLQRGVLIDRYVILHELGAGGMGIVYAAYDPELDRKIAIKVIQPGPTDNLAGSEGRMRLLREAQALARLTHPNVVGVHDVGVHDEQVWIAMEFVHGETLADWLARRRSWREILGVMEAAGRGLAAAHTAGLLHRDFKPSNLMLGKDGRVRVMDFGLARAGMDPAVDTIAGLDTAARPELAALAAPLTHVGAVMGTPAYMAPEQFQGGEVTAQADQFAFCVTLWEALYGERPFAGSTMIELMSNIIHGKRRPPSKVRPAPTWLRRVCERGLIGDPKQRWPSMAALLVALESGIPRQRRRIAATVGLTIAAALASTSVYERWSAQQRADACWAEGQEMVTKWDESRAAIAAAFVTAAPDVGEQSFTRVSRHMDHVTADWASAKSRLCMLPEIDGRWTPNLVARANECLLASRWEFDSSLESFARGDDVRQAASTAAGLASARPCLDLLHLARQPPPPPDDVRAEVARVRRSLRQIRKLGKIGRFHEGLEEVRKQVAEADAIGWKPLAAQVRWTAVKFANDLGDFKSAEAWIDEGIVLATESSQDTLLADFLTMMTDLIGVRLARHDDGLHWGKLARAMNIAQGDGDNPRGAWTLTVLALLHQARGDLAQAEQLLKTTLTIHLAAAGSDSLDVVGTLLNLGNLYLRRESWEDARLSYQRALSGFERILGPDHPDVALALGNLSLVQVNLGELDEAERLGLRALGIRERTSGPEGLDTARAQQDLGDVYLRRGETAKALDLLERAAISMAKSLGTEHPELGRILLSLGEVYYERHDLDKAQMFYTRALDIAETTYGPNHYETSPSQLGLGEVALARDRHVEAVQHLSAAANLFATNERPRDAAYAHFTLAQAYWLSKETRAEARALAVQAAEEMAILGDSNTRAEVVAWLAEHQ